MNDFSYQRDYEISAESNQALTRVVIALLTFGLFYFAGPNISVTNTSEIVIIIRMYFFYAVALWLYISYRPGIYPWRRIVGIVSDMGVVSYAMALGGAVGEGFYPLYIWIIIGNGMRFGQRYLYLAMYAGLIGFGYVIVRDPFLREHIPTAVGLWVGMTVIGLYVNSLQKRVDSLNARLTSQLDQTHYAATHDPLTDLLNSREFYRRLSSAILHAEQQHTAFVVLYIDIDGFKGVNDQRGHHAGDALLKHIADRIKHTIRSTDFAARLGGDEFAIALLDIETSPQIEDQLAKKITCVDFLTV